MKTYEEMAQSVVRRAKAHKTNRNRCILGVTAAVCVLGISLGVMAAREPSGKEPLTLQTPPVTEPVAPQAPRITMLYNDGSETVGMQKDVILPYRMEIRTRDVSGLTEAEVEAVYAEEANYANELVASYPREQGYNWNQFRVEDMVFTYINAGHFILGIDDPALIKRISATFNGAVAPTNMMEINGHLTREDIDRFHRGDFSMEYYAYQVNTNAINELYDYYGGYSFGLHLNSEWVRWYVEDPADLPELFQDTISITVTFQDGTTENHVIDLMCSESGQVYAIYRGLTTDA